MGDTAGSVTRREALLAGASAGAAMVAACAPGAVEPPPPVDVSSMVGWTKEWEELVAAAKKEGKVAVQSLTGTGYRKGLEAFEAAFGIATEHRAEVSASIWIPKLQKERDAGIYELDVAIVPANSALVSLKPTGTWDPLKPAVFRPDVLDDKAWRNGFDSRFMDLESKLAFGYDYAVRRVVGINTDLVKDGEIKGFKDLLDPRWRGRIAASDVRVGDTFLAMANLRQQLGDQVVRTLLVDQQPSFIRDSRQLIEGLVRGRYPICLGMRPEVLLEFQEQGVAGKVKILDTPELDYLPAFCMFLMNRAPHPNAAKLFINWFLTKEGQTALAKNLPANSARTDVEIFDRESAAQPGVKYYETGKEAVYDWIIDTQKFINGLVGVTN